MTPLVGRTGELGAMRGAFDGGARIVTLHGLGGVGKTRLAYAFAEAWRGDSVHVDLAVARTLPDVCAVVSRALDVRAGEAADSLPKRIGDVLARRGDLLLVLDNLEQLDVESTRAIGAWSVSTRILATSRRPIEEPGEVVIDVEPLPIDDDAIDLFLLRARSRAHAVEDRARAREIVSRLEGIPLAIELAAARLDVLPLASIADRLGERFALLRNPMSPRERHGTMLGALEWSWDLLEPWQKKALAQASVFEGTFGIDDAAAVLEVDALDGVHALVGHSLARVVDSRFSLLETVREFARAKLEDGGEHDAAWDRHARHFVLRDLPLALSGASVHVATLERDRDDLVAILRRTKDVETAAKALLALLPVLFLRSPASERLALVDDVLARGGIAEGTDLRLRLVHARVSALRQIGRVDDALRVADEAVAIAPPAIAAMLLDEATAAETVRGNPHEARRRAETAEPLCAGEPRLLGRVLLRHSLADCDLADFDAAMDYASRALALFDDPRDRSAANIALGVCAFEKGDLETCREHFERAATVSEAIGEHRQAAVARGYLGGVAHEREEWAVARAAYTRAHATFARIVERRLEAIYLGYVGIVDSQSGDPERGRAKIEEARALLAAIPDPRYESTLAAALAGVDALCGRLDEARAALDRLEERRTDHLAKLLQIYRATCDAVEGRFEESRADALAHTPLEDARLAMPFLRRALRERRDRERAWSFDPGGLAFRSPNGETVRIDTHAALARIVSALVRQRMERPGEPATRETLIAAGWPDEERISPESARNRLKVAVSTLRKSGLEPILQTHAKGYLLDPAVPIRSI